MPDLRAPLLSVNDLQSAAAGVFPPGGRGAQSVPAPLLQVYRVVVARTGPGAVPELPVQGETVTGNPGQGFRKSAALGQEKDETMALQSQTG